MKKIVKSSIRIIKYKKAKKCKKAIMFQMGAMTFSGDSTQEEIDELG